jgi:PBSX family phage terminase large subunit
MDKLPFTKTPKQVMAVQVQNSHLHSMLYGGSRSGKTFINLRSVMARALKTKSRHLVARHRFNHLKQSIIFDTLPKMMRLSFPELNYDLNRSDWFVTLPNGSEVWFGGLDDAARVDKVLGNEYSTIFLNECTQLSWDARNTVMSRLAENSGLALRAFYDCNPTSTKHWTYTVFKQGLTPDGEKIANMDAYASLQMNPADNMANLPPEYIALLQSLPARQRKRFLEGEFQNDVEGALWNVLMVEQAKARGPVELKKKVLGVDPAITSKADSDTTGIVLCGLDINNNGAVLADYSIKASPQAWAQRVVNAYYENQCAYIVVEVNQGGDMAKTIIHSIDRNIHVKEVRAAVGKFARAEPVAALYEQGKVWHADTTRDMNNNLLDLEAELCEYVPITSAKSPDRLDAAVWGLTDLMLGAQGNTLITKLRGL